MKCPNYFIAPFKEDYLKSGSIAWESKAEGTFFKIFFLRKIAVSLVAVGFKALF